MRLAVLRDLVKKVLPEAEHVVVVFLVEAALQDVVIGQGGEAAVLGGHLKPGSGLLEILLGILDIAQGIIGRGRIVRVRKVLHAQEQALGALPLPLRKGAVAHLVGIFRLLRRLDILDGHLVELLQGFLIQLLVKVIQAQQITDLRDQEVLMVAGDEGLGDVPGMGGFELERTEGAITFRHGCMVVLDQPERLRVHAGLIQVFHLPEILGIHARGQA